ncbi:hypothetical protein BJ165DRAFT_1407231 [Panaeolus papilionaceus]|nr:hypothetical protein BJ165DRAFT_1407231 [Panaeolus papilionaceus]
MPKISPSTPKRIYDAMTYTISPIKYLFKAMQPSADPDDTPSAGSSSSSSPGGSTQASTRAQTHYRRRQIPTSRREVQRQNSLRKERSFRINERSNHANLPVEKLGAATAAAIAQNISVLDPSHNIIAVQLNKMLQNRNVLTEELADSSLADIFQVPISPSAPQTSNVQTGPLPTAAPAPRNLQPRSLHAPRRSIRLHQADRDRKQEEAARAFALKKSQEAERRKLEEELGNFRTKYHQHAGDAEQGLSQSQQFLDSLNQDLIRARSLHAGLHLPDAQRFHSFSNDVRLNSMYEDAVDSYHEALKTGKAFVNALESLINVVERRTTSWLRLRSILSSMYQSFHNTGTGKDATLALFKEVKQRQRDCSEMKPLTSTEEKVELLAQTYKVAFELAQFKQQAYDGEIVRIMEERRRIERERALQEEIEATRMQEEKRTREAEVLRERERERVMAAHWAAEQQREEARYHLEQAARRTAEAELFAQQQAAYRAQAEWEKEQILQEARSHFASYQGQHQHHQQSAGPIPVDVSMRTVCDEPEPQYNFNDISMADCTAPPPPRQEAPSPQPTPQPRQEAPRPQPTPHQEVPRPQAPPPSRQEIPRPQAAPQPTYRPRPAPAQEVPQPAPPPRVAPYPEPSTSGRITRQQRVALHEARWKVLRGSDNIPPISFRQMPWPVLSDAARPSDLTKEAFEAFYQAAASGKSRARVIKEALLRFHPDKFSKLEAKIQVGALDDVRAGMALVIHYLNDIKNDD